MSAFTDAIANNWPDHIIAPGSAASCEQCRSIHGIADGADLEAAQEIMENDEGSFSWSQCQSCNSRLGGDRHTAHAIHNEAFGPDAKRPDDIVHIDICTDCLMFHANGEEPE